MSIENQQKSIPRSMRHRQILDVAEGNPSASIAEIAAQVPSATPELVEHVFEEHGDPVSADGSPPEGDEKMSSPTDQANQESDAESEPTSEPSSETAGTDDQATAKQAAADEETETHDADSEVETESLEVPSEKHRDLLEAVAARPAATQADLAEELDVTRATISRWASEIPGFEWRERESVVAAVADADHAIDVTKSTPDANTAAATQTTPAADNAADATAVVTELKADLAALTERVAALEAADESVDTDSGFDDPELVHKVVHACVESEHISEAEELRILKRLLE